MAKPIKKKELSPIATKEKDAAKGTNGDNLTKYLESLKKNGVLGDITKKIDYISTGSLIVDRLIGDGTGTGSPGGIPRGFIAEIYGDESCGKTTFALHVSKEAQKIGPVVWVDFERTLRVQYPYIKNIGLDIRAPKFIHIEPNDFEEGALHIVESLIRIKPSLIIIDSLTAMMPKAMIEKEADEAGAIGQHARLTSVFLNKITKFLVKSNTALLVINQKRNAIKGQYEEGPKTTTSGGNAMRFYATIRINMKVKSRTEVTEMNALTGVKEKKKVDQEVKIIIEKNKSDIPWKSASIWIKFGKGIDNVMSIVKLASATGVIKSSGAGWSEYVDKEKPQYSFKVQGDVGVWTKLSENPEILESVYSKLVFDVDQEEKSSAAEDPELELSDEDAELLADMRTSLGVDKKPKLESIEDSLE